MDVWLLAAQLMLSCATTPPDPTAIAEGTVPVVMGAPHLAPETFLEPECGQDISSANGSIQVAPEPRPLAQRHVLSGTPSGAPSGAPSMAAAVTQWPSQRRPWVSGPRRPSSPASGPVSGPQLYQFRVAALRAGELYTQADPQRYLSQWQGAIDPPTHDQWQALLAGEAATVARRQGQRSLTILLGDSLTLWLPLRDLPAQQLWLNQSISGETTANMLERLDYFAQTHPGEIHVMGGINDLKNGVSEAEVIDNLYQILTRLKRQHPQARLVVYSILPTRLRAVPSDRIQRVNQALATLAAHQGATFVDLTPTFSDSQGQLRPELTTDGLHLSAQGYTLWRDALVSHGNGLGH